MNELTRDLGHSLLLFLWETSTYPDADDTPARSRRELAIRVVDSLCDSTYGLEADLQQIVKGFVAEFANSPYRERAKRFGTDLIAMVTGERDAEAFLKMGRLARRQFPKRRVPRREVADARRRVRQARAKALGNLASTSEGLQQRKGKGKIE